MDQFRQAKCTAPACAATFKVPGSFTASKAKCPKCGGVVEIGPVQSAAPKAEAPKPEAAKAESGAPAPKPVPAAVPPPKPAAVPQAAAPKAAAPAPKAVAPKPSARPAAPTAKPSASAAKPAAPSVRDAAASAASKVKSGAATPASSKAKKGAAEEPEAEGKRPRHVHKEKSKAPMILGAVFCLALAGAAGWWFGVKMPAEEKAKQEAAALEAKQKREAADAKAAKDKAEMEAADASRLAAAGAAEQQKNEAASTDASEKPATKPATPKASDANIVDDIDLTAFPELPKQSACSDEQWATLQDDARTLIDPAAGAKGGRAGKRLLEAGRLAVPALLNQFRTINPATDEGRKAGDLIQKTLERICNGRNFGWQYTTELKDVVYNKKAIKNWFKIWETVGEDEQQWLGFTKQLPKEGEGSKPADGEGKAASGLDDF